MGYHQISTREFLSDFGSAMAGAAVAVGSVVGGSQVGTQIANAVGASDASTYALEVAGMASGPAVVTGLLYAAYRAADERWYIAEEVQSNIAHGLGCMMGIWIIAAAGLAFSKPKTDAVAAEQPVVGEIIGRDTGVAPSAFDMSFPGMELNRA
jgi:hypothetical protein